MAILFKNNASTKLASGITAAATTMSVVAGTGDLFPNPGVWEYFLCTLVDDLGNKEIVKVTARTADTFTIVRAREGTTARAFNANSLVENRLTAGALNEVLNVTYASGEEVAAGVATNKAISPATVRNAFVKSAIFADTCTGNAATATLATTAADMAAGHALAGATTIVEVRNRVIGSSSMTAYFRDMRAGDIVMRAHAIRTLDDGLPEALLLNGDVVSLTTFPRLMRMWGGASVNNTVPAFYRCNADGTRNAEGMYMRLLDMRGYVPRGLDYGRGIDPNRALASLQEDAIRNIAGQVGGCFYLSNNANTFSTGPFAAFATLSPGIQGSSNDAGRGVRFDASSVVPTASENRMRNAALMFVIYV